MRTLRFRSLLALAAVSLGAAACEPDRAVIPQQVLGVWTDSVAVSQEVTWAHWLDLRPNGEFYWDQITYGGAPYSHDTPAYRTILHGRYRLRPGVMEVRVESIEYSGAAHGKTTTEVVDEPRWSGDAYGARFSGDDLEITFFTAPFDTPIEHRLSFSRQQPGRPID